MATTTNYGWTTPDDTALVKDGASAIRTLGTSVDTTTKNLNPSTTLGDLEFRSSTSNVNTRLGIGSSGQFLSVVAGVPAWAALADQTPLTTKGDLFTFSTLDARVGVGANNTVLTADSAEATGLKWATPAAGSLTLLSTTSLSGATTTISSIDQTYTHLQIFVFGVTNATNNGATRMKPNNAETVDYIKSAYETTDTAYTKGENAGSWGLTINDSHPSRTSADNMYVLNIYNYASATIQKAITGAGAYFTAGGYMMMLTYGGKIDTTSAITSLVFLSGGGDLTAGTVLVYGVK